MKIISFGRVLLTTICCVLFEGYAAFSQQVTANFLADTSSASEYKKIMLLWEKYISSRPDSVYDNPYWNSKEKSQYESFDFLSKYFSPSTYMGFPSRVLSIKYIPEGEYYEIKSMFSYCQEDGTPYVLCILNVLAQKDGGEYKLKNILPINLKRHRWQYRRTKYVDYYFPPYHDFSFQNAQRLNLFIDSISAIFDVPPKKIEYYFADTYDEVMEIMGFDYYMGMGGEIKPTGRVQPNNRILCGGLGEYYPHEVVHLIIDPHYSETFYWMREGLATFLGGSRGKDLNEIIRITNTFLEGHPEIDLDTPFKFSYASINEFVDYKYAIGGLWCKIAYDKGGWDLVKELMRSSLSEESTIDAVCEMTQVSKENLNEFMRAKFKEYASF